MQGLTQFGVNLLTLSPDTWSSQRHWHKASDELVYVLQGEVVLVTDGGEELLRVGDAAAFKAGDNNGHCLQNRSDQDALVLEIGSRIAGDAAYYSDIDMVSPLDAKPAAYTHRDGTPYDDIRHRGPEGERSVASWRCRNALQQRILRTLCMDSIARCHDRCGSMTTAVRFKSESVSHLNPLTNRSFQ